jgi:hypothetical protein
MCSKGVWGWCINSGRRVENTPSTTAPVNSFEQSEAKKIFDDFIFHEFFLKYIFCSFYILSVRFEDEIR